MVELLVIPDSRNPAPDVARVGAMSAVDREA